jgi:hypothetical protein
MIVAKAQTAIWKGSGAWPGAGGTAMPAVRYSCSQESGYRSRSGRVRRNEWSCSSQAAVMFKKLINTTGREGVSGGNAPSFAAEANE